jgi:hypothetical protein
MIAASLLIVGVLAQIAAPAPDLCMSIERADSLGLTYATLTAEYISATAKDASPFHRNEDPYWDAWHAFIQPMSKRLIKANPAFRGVTFSYLAFLEADGRVRYFLYSHVPPALEQTFCATVRDAVASYRFPLKAERKFSQCGTVVLAPEDEKHPGP